MNSLDASVLLVIPPGSYADMPTLAIGCLQAYLKQQGMKNIHAWDANLDYLSFLLNPENLKLQEERIRKGDAGKNSNELRDRVLFSLPYICEAIGDVDRIFHDPLLYYDLKSFSRAMALVKSALEVYNTESDPIDYRFDSTGFFISTRQSELPASVPSLISYAKNPSNWWWFKNFFSSMLPKLKKQKSYDWVGFSCPNPQQFLPTLMLARLFKETGLAKHTVLGGSFISAQRNKICNLRETYDLFDYVITFEGEEALFQLIQSVASDEEPKAVPGVHYAKSNEIIHNPPKIVKDLSALPTPDFSGLPLHAYWTPEPVLPSYSTRGCYYDICTFCNHHENYFGKFRTRKTENVIEDLKMYEKLYNANKIFFVDELMVPKQHMEIATRITEEGLKTRWYCHARVEKQFTKEALKTLADGGVTLLHVGMESANTRVLEMMKKGYDRDRVLRFLKDVSELPITLHLNTIQSHPGETPAEYIETLETAWNFVKGGDYVHLYGFVLDEGAPILEQNNPYLSNIRESQKHNLHGALEFDRVNVQKPTKKEEQQIRSLRTALGTLAILNDIYPEECCWAAHLLYVSHYRETKRGQVIDQPLKELSLDSKILRSFQDKETLSQSTLTASRFNILRQQLEVGGALKWYILNIETFAHIGISENTANLFQSKKTALSTDMFPDKVELYRLIRMGVLQLQQNQKKDRTEVQRKSVHS